MTSRSTALGEPKVQRKRIQEVHELPEGRAAIVSKFEHILNSGGVHKVVVELGRPIKVERLVRVDEVGEVMDLQDDDWMNAARNNEMQEFQGDASQPFQYLFQMFMLLSQKRLKPRIFIVNNVDSFKAWLKIDRFVDLREVYGVEVRGHTAVTEDVGVLVATTPEETDTVVLSLKFYTSKETK